MKRAPDEFDELQSLYTDVKPLEEKGVEYFYLPSLTIVVNGVKQVYEALLCPEQHSGYKTRLFLNSPVPEKGKNWTAHVILNRSWHTHSWNGVPSELRLSQILASHIGSYK